MSEPNPFLRSSATRAPAALAGALALVLVLSCVPPPPGRVYVVRRPPPERVEVVGPAPGPAFVYVRGYWRYDGRDYAWVPGRWARLEGGYHKWVPGHWKHDRRGWYWVEGYWR